MKKVKNKIGPPVEGDNFYGREKELAYVWRRLEDNNVILPAPRRVGKSSFAKKLLAKAKAEGWETLEINLEQIHTEQEFLAVFTDKLRELSWWDKVKQTGEKVLNAVKALKPVIKYESVEVTLEWQRQKADVYHQLNQLLDHQQKTLIFFDELAVLLTHLVQREDGQRSAEQFLHWLRGLRQTTGTQIRWIFCSSVGIENFTFKHQMTDTINDVTAYQLKPFDRETALGLILALEQGNNIFLSDELRAAMLDKLGEYYLPFFIQILFAQIHQTVEVDEIAPNAIELDNCYQALLDQSHLNTWIERIKEQYGDLEGDTFALLKNLCQSKKGEKRDNLLNILAARHVNDFGRAEDQLNTLLYMLKNDGYIDDTEGAYYFRSPLIRDFWYRRFVK
jgi:uncharacterized protein